MKEVVVTKKRSHVAVGLSIGAAAAVMPLVLTGFFHLPAEMMLLLFLPIWIVVGTALMYMTTWKIRFSTDGIEKTAFRRLGRKYAWHEVRDVICRWSTAEGGTFIRITFVSGDPVKFRLDDENGEKAKKYILSHHTIRNLS